MLRRAPLLGLALALLGTAACTGGDDAAPTLMVDSPARGTIAASGEVSVSGTVVDDGDVQVTVNGTAATVAPDGSFTATVEVPPGVQVIETIATDAAGQTGRDVRAVMTGDLRPADGNVPDGIGAKVGPAAFAVISDVVGDTVNGLDLGAIAQPLNPVVSTGGSCFGVDVSVTDANVGNFQIDLAPVPGDVAIDATVTDLEIRLRADFALACIDGSDDVVITASSVHLTGGLGLRAGGGLHASVDGLQISISGLYLDVGGLPSSIVNLFSDQIADIVASTLTQMVDEKVPPMVEQALTDLSGKSWTLSVLDRDVAVGANPTRIDLDYDGAFVALDTSMRVGGGAGGQYVSSPAPLTAAMMPTNGLGIAVSADALNQLFAGMWASGALDQHVAVDRTSPIALVIDGDTTDLEVAMSLPPTVAMDPSGDLRLTVGDLMLHAKDAQGTDLMTIALTLSTTLGVETTEDQHLALRLGEPSVHAQVVSQEERPVALTDHDVENLVETVFPMVARAANTAMASMPLPSVMGVSLDGPTLESRDGYVVLQSNVSYAP